MIILSQHLVPKDSESPAAPPPIRILGTAKNFLTPSPQNLHGAPSLRQWLPFRCQKNATPSWQVPYCLGTPTYEWPDQTQLCSGWDSNQRPAPYPVLLNIGYQKHALGQWCLNKFKSGGTNFFAAPLHFLAFGDRLRDGQCSFLFAVSLLTVPPCPDICKSGGTCPMESAPLRSAKQGHFGLIRISVITNSVYENVSKLYHWVSSVF